MLIHLGYIDLEDRSQRTRDLLTILVREADLEERVRILVDPGQQRRLIARVRVMLSRARKALEKRGKSYVRFRLRAETTPYTDRQGKRYTAIYMWRERTETHEAIELIEDIIHGYKAK